jgi:MFS family permease
MMEATSKRSWIHRMPFFYGWIVAAAGTLGLIMTQPGQSPVLSIFTDAFIEHLNLSRSLTSTLFTIGTVVAGLSLSFWGEQIDRHGPRTMVGVITGLFGISCLYMGLVRNAWMLGVGYVLLRMLGASALMLVATNVINQWWVERRGTVMGISGVVVALVGMGLFTNMVHGLLQRFDWRMTYVILGAMELLVMLPLGLLLFRDRPEDHGLRPDGQLDGLDDTDERAEVPVSWTRAQALRSPAFWVTVGSFATTSLVGTGLYFHMVSIFEAQGLSSDVAAAVYLPISVTSAVVRLGSGYLADRIPIRILLAVGLVAMSGVLGLAQIIDGTPLAVVYGVVMGLSGGITGVVGSVIWADYFGRRHLGSISGLATSISRISSALGPLPLALAFDLLGGYGLALKIEMAIPLALAGLNLFVKPPRGLPADG